MVARRRRKRFKPSGRSFGAARYGQFDRFADAIEESVDVPALEQIICAARAVAAPH
jgi:hypothetical protein